MPRFDDIIRSERYFTATLLPALLFHEGENGKGVEAFVDLVEKRATTERTRDGAPKTKDVLNYEYEEVEVITEFDIARDLRYAELKLEANLSPETGVEQNEEGEPERERRDAPDIVIVAGPELVVCEGKFFSAFNIGALNNQLRSQRRQVRHLFLNRPQLRAYRHVAVVPEPVDLDADAVLTWDDIGQLAEKVMGPDHYVTVRLRMAVARHQIEVDPDIRNYDGILSFYDMREKCRESGELIRVGHTGGKPNLVNRDLVYCEKKRWKWRNPATNPGTVNRNNWLIGTDWLAIVEHRVGG
jgi:hypothetical protein